MLITAPSVRVRPSSFFSREYVLQHVGEDCADAVQFVRADRLDTLQRSADQPDTVSWLTDAEVAGRLRILATDNSAWRLAGDAGQFSLAGAHAKTAMTHDGRRWGIPSGRTPTTHILKPPVPGLDGFAENEHICLELARELGVPAARSSVVQFEDQVVIAVERFDRRAEAGRWTRIHQEDLCQSLTVHPDRKYESEGGPGVSQVVDLLRGYSSAPEEDVWTFVRALIVNWLIVGTDAHAENCGALIDAHESVRLAPLYDIASALPYAATMPLRKLKLAMKVGGEYLVHRIGARQWRALAELNGLAPTDVLSELHRMAAATPESIERVRDRTIAGGLRTPIIDELASGVAARARECAGEVERALG
jgi:serine/threonine-protein kinase HipA